MLRNIWEWIKSDDGCWVLSRLIFIIGGIIACVFLFGKIKDWYVESSNAYSICLDNGYPDLISSQDNYYCHKLENGNDVIVSVESLRDGY